MLVPYHILHNINWVTLYVAEYNKSLSHSLCGNIRLRFIHIERLSRKANAKVKATLLSHNLHKEMGNSLPSKTPYCGKVTYATP